MALDQRQLADYMRRMRQQGMNINAAPITMESQIAGQGMNINAAPITMESQIAEQVNAPVSAGMVSGYAAQGREAEMRKRAQDFSGEERAIEAQMAMAQQLRGREAPKGRTVGPYDVYVGPNWGESVAGLTNSIAGGLVQRSANKKDIALDEKRTEARLSKAMEEQRRYKQGFDLQTDQFGEAVRSNIAGETHATDTLDETKRGNKFGETHQGLVFDETVRSNKVTEEFDSATLAQRAAKDAAQLAFDRGKGETRTYSTPDGNVTVKEDVSGVSWDFDEDGEITTTIKIQDGWKKLDEQRTVAMTSAEAEAADNTRNNADNAIFGITMTSDIFRADNDIWNDATGLGVESVITGATGFASPSEAGPKIQEFQRKVQKLGFEGMKDDFERLNLGQINKGEFEAVSKANANWKTEPLGLVMLQAGKIPMYEEAFNLAIAAGTHTNAQRDVHIQKMEDDVIYGATQINQKTGKPTVDLAELERKGIDVSGRRAELLEKLSSDTATQEDKALLKAIIMARKAA